MTKRFAVIDAGKVENTILAEAGFTLPGKTLVQSDTAAIGDLWDGEAFTKPPAPPAPVPSSVTRRQLLLGLFAGGYITAQEAEAAAATGAVPAILAEVIDAMPEPQAVAARITWASMSVAERSDPMWGAIIAAELATGEQIDDLFRAAATL